MCSYQKKATEPFFLDIEQYVYLSEINQTIFFLDRRKETETRETREIGWVHSI